MDQSERWMVIVGAAAGAAVGYVVGTSGGRQFLRTVVAAVDDFAEECGRFSSALGRAQHAASDSWKAFDQWKTESRFFGFGGATGAGDKDSRMGNGQKGGQV